MKKTLILASTLLALSAHGGYKRKLFKVSVTNLTKGQPLTPVVVAVHSPKISLFKLGAKASKGLEKLAEDGVTSEFVRELENTKKVVRTAVGEGITLPGKTSEITIEANNSSFKLSLTGMLARTNDAIVVAKGLSTRLKKGQSYQVIAEVYDAGTEANTELCSDIPAPPCNSPMSGPESGEGFIRPHEGVNGHGELDLARDTFSNKVALVKVQRIQ